MQAHVNASAEHQQAKKVDQPSKELSFSETTFEDNRAETAQLKAIQAITCESPQSQKMQTLQRRMASSDSKMHNAISATNSDPVVQRFQRGADHLSEEARKTIKKQFEGEFVNVADDNQAVLTTSFQRAYLSDSVAKAQNGLTKTSNSITLPLSNTDMVTLYQWDINSSFDSDCGRTARKIMQMVNGLPSDKNEFVTDTPEGEVSALSPRSVPHLKEDILEKWNRNNSAKPKIGEAYVIAPDKSWKGGVQFHWGAVVAKTGGDVITYESFAGWDKTGFQIYNSEPDPNSWMGSFNTFHEIWEGTFSGANPQTFVVRPRGIGSGLETGIASSTKSEINSGSKTESNLNSSLEKNVSSEIGSIVTSDWKAFVKLIQDGIESKRTNKQLYDYYCSEIVKFDTSLWAQAYEKKLLDDELKNALGDYYEKFRLDLWYGELSL